MNWKIKYTKQALEDLKAIYEYIAFKLLVANTARKQVRRIAKAIKTLDFMPERFKIYREEPWKSLNMRCLPVDNYIVFYLLQEKTYTVNIVRIIYGGRNISQQLKETKEL